VAQLSTLGVTMRTATHKHLSVVDGLARFARVTVVESSDGSSLPEPVLLLNDHQIDRRSEAEPNKSLEPTADGVVSSAIAVEPRWRVGGGSAFYVRPRAFLDFTLLVWLAKIRAVRFR
jgi:hypothetical protein